MAEEYRIGDLVWAKMKGFPWWPSMVGKPRDDVKKPAGKNYHFIEFFGTNNYAWIQDSSVKKFDDNAAYAKCNKSSFKEALEALKKHRSRRTASEISTSKASSDVPKKPVSVVKKKSLPAKEPDTSKTNGDVLKKTATVPLKRKSLPTKEPDTSKANGEVLKKPATVPLKRKSVSPHGRPVKKHKQYEVRRIASSSSSSSIAASTDPIAFLRAISGPVIDEEPDADHSYNYDFFSSILNGAEDEGPMGTQKLGGLAFTSKSFKTQGKKCPRSNLRIGFLGLGTMGAHIAKNLIDTEHHLTVWNRDPFKCIAFKDAGADIAHTPGDVVECSDVIFCCVSDPDAAKEIVFGNCGVLQKISKGKGYVEMTSIDPGTSKDIADAIQMKGGRYLEAPLQGSSQLVAEGQLIILAAGDNQLFDDCESCFESIAEHAFYLGEIGNASKMNLIVMVLMAMAVASISEAMSLSKRLKLPQDKLLEVLRYGPMSCPYMLQKAESKPKNIMVEDKDFKTNTPLMHMQKDLHLAMKMSNAIVQPIPVTAQVNEIFKHAKQLGYGKHDISAIYRARF